MTKTSSKLALVTNAPAPSLKCLADPQHGPLAEAEAIADALNQLTCDDASVRDDTLATLSTMLCARLDQVRGVVEDHLSGGAA